MTFISQVYTHYFSRLSVRYRSNKTIIRQKKMLTAKRPSNIPLNRHQSSVFPLMTKENLTTVYRQHTQIVPNTNLNQAPSTATLIPSSSHLRNGVYELTSSDGVWRWCLPWPNIKLFLPPDDDWRESCAFRLALGIGLGLGLCCPPPYDVMVYSPSTVVPSRSTDLIPTCLYPTRILLG